MSTTYTIYFAGDLFDHKHLIGNAILASYIDKCSEGRYQCILPQDLEQPSGRGVAIRNNDLQKVIECDLGLFNFDGADLDSGTVAEFLFAKALDIPAVLLRSDLRTRNNPLGDDWNLMCSGYPRTQIVQFNGMAWYHEAMQGSQSVAETTDRLCTRMAARLIMALDAVRQEPPLPKAELGSMENWYRWALRFPGSGLEELCSASGYVEQIVASKRGKGLI